MKKLIGNKIRRITALMLSVMLVFYMLIFDSSIKINAVINGYTSGSVITSNNWNSNWKIYGNHGLTGVDVNKTPGSIYVADQAEVTGNNIYSNAGLSLQSAVNFKNTFFRYDINNISEYDTVNIAFKSTPMEYQPHYSVGNNGAAYWNGGEGYYSLFGGWDTFGSTTGFSLCCILNSSKKVIFASLQMKLIVGGEYRIFVYSCDFSSNPVSMIPQGESVCKLGFDSNCRAVIGDTVISATSWTITYTDYPHLEYTQFGDFNKPYSTWFTSSDVGMSSASLYPAIGMTQPGNDCRGSFTLKTINYGGTEYNAINFFNNPFTVTYNVNGGTIDSGSNVQLLNYGDFLNPPIVSRTGYSFNGWLLGETNLGKNISSLPYQIIGNSEITAEWKGNTYNVHFDGNGADSGTMADQSFTYGKSTQLTANAFLKTGYDFLGWSTDGQTVKYRDGESVSNLSAVDNATVTLYAIWKPHEYTLTWNFNGGIAEGSYTDGLVPFGTVIVIPSPTRLGYSFSSWTPSVPSTMPANDLTITAEWAANKTTLSFNQNGGNGGVTGTKIAVFDSSMPSLSDYTKPTRDDNYIFVGYFDSIDGGTMYYDSSLNSMRSWDKDVDSATLYAHWSNSDYTVTYNAKEGVFDNGDKTISVTVPGQLTEIPLPSSSPYGMAQVPSYVTENGIDCGFIGWFAQGSDTCVFLYNNHTKTWSKCDSFLLNSDVTLEARYCAHDDWYSNYGDTKTQHNAVFSEQFYDGGTSKNNGTTQYDSSYCIGCHKEIMRKLNYKYTNRSQQYTLLQCSVFFKPTYDYAVVHPDFNPCEKGSVSESRFVGWGYREHPSDAPDDWSFAFKYGDSKYSAVKIFEDNTVFVANYGDYTVNGCYEVLLNADVNNFCLSVYSNYPIYGINSGYSSGSDIGSWNAEKGLGYYTYDSVTEGRKGDGEGVVTEYGQTLSEEWTSDTAYSGYQVLVIKTGETYKSAFNKFPSAVNGLTYLRCWQNPLVKVISNESFATTYAEVYTSTNEEIINGPAKYKELDKVFYDLFIHPYSTSINPLNASTCGYTFNYSCDVVLTANYWASETGKTLKTAQIRYHANNHNGKIGNNATFSSNGFSDGRGIVSNEGETYTSTVYSYAVASDEYSLGNCMQMYYHDYYVFPEIATDPMGNAYIDNAFDTSSVQKIGYFDKTNNYKYISLSSSEYTVKERSIGSYVESFGHGLDGIWDDSGALVFKDSVYSDEYNDTLNAIEEELKLKYSESVVRNMMYKYNMYDVSVPVDIDTHPKVTARSDTADRSFYIKGDSYTQYNQSELNSNTFETSNSWKYRLSYVWHPISRVNPLYEYKLGTYSWCRGCYNIIYNSSQGGLNYNPIYEMGASEIFVDAAAATSNGQSPFDIYQSWDVGVRYYAGKAAVNGDKNNYAFEYINDGIVSNYAFSLLNTGNVRDLGWSYKNQALTGWFIDYDCDGEWDGHFDDSGNPVYYSVNEAYDVNNNGKLDNGVQEKIYMMADYTLNGKSSLVHGYKFRTDGINQGLKDEVIKMSDALEEFNYRPITLTAYWEDCNFYLGLKSKNNSLFASASGSNLGKIVYTDVSGKSVKYDITSKDNWLYVKDNTVVSLELYSKDNYNPVYLTNDIPYYSQYKCVFGETDIACPDRIVYKNPNLNSSDRKMTASVFFVDNKAMSAVYNISDQSGEILTDRNNKILPTPVNGHTLYDKGALNRSLLYAYNGISDTKLQIYGFGTENYTVSVTGAINSGTYNCKYDSVLTLKADPATFKRWVVNGETVSTSPIFNYRVLGNAEIRAERTGSQDARISISDFGSVNGRKYATSSWFVPDNSIVIETGVIVSKGIDTDLSANTVNDYLNTDGNSVYKYYKIVSSETNLTSNFRVILKSDYSYSVIPYIYYVKDNRSYMLYGSRVDID
ncbi:MAG: InlB B-repeat-containing protein [Clostridia bacterium]|nr:InlB B-repeat-containing protein [Clostridia bacterium]